MKKREKVKKRKNRKKTNIFYSKFLYIKFKIFFKIYNVYFLNYFEI